MRLTLIGVSFWLFSSSSASIFISKKIICCSTFASFSSQLLYKRMSYDKRWPWYLLFAFFSLSVCESVYFLRFAFIWGRITPKEFQSSFFGAVFQGRHTKAVGLMWKCVCMCVLFVTMTTICIKRVLKQMFSEIYKKLCVYVWIYMYVYLHIHKQTYSFTFRLSISKKQHTLAYIRRHKKFLLFQP